jgi:hypothetical protein
VPRVLYPPLLLAALWLAFFAPLALHPGQVLYSDHSDFLAETLPGKHFLVCEWRATGEVPLWNPYVYAGNPFLHDVKAAVFYPPHLPLYLLPDAAVGPALSWIVALHVLIAGLCMYAYARRRGLGAAGALTAAIGYMFAGKWLLHLLAGGHAFLAPLAWLPLALLLLEAAVRRHSPVRALWAGAAFALVVLGAHPQATFYAGVFTAVWSLGPALADAGFLGGAGPRSPRRTAAALARWAAFGVLTAGAAAALSAAVLLPAVEAAREATRGLGVPADEGAAGALLAALRLVGPSIDGPQWEGRGGVGVLWLAVATAAPVLGRGRVRFDALVGMLLLVFALGGGAVLQAVPGFGLFQLHHRMLLAAAVPLSLLAGFTVQTLFTPPGPSPEGLRRARRVLTAAAAA